MDFSQRKMLLGITSLTLTSCLGPFETVYLNDASNHDKNNSQEDTRKITFAHLNAADLRGNTGNIFKFISREKALYRAEWLADFCSEENIDILALNEIDYAGTVKTGGLDQPAIIAGFMGYPYNYVVFDQYMKSPLWTTGNAVISHFPMKSIHRHLFGADGDHFDTRLEHLFKDFIHVEAGVGKRKLQIIYTHLDDGDGEYSFRRKEQTEELTDYINAYVAKNPDSFIVLAGDLNDGKESATMKKILKSGTLHPPTEGFGQKTYPSDKPLVDLDHILASKNIAIHTYKTFHFPWSDHRGLTCELEFLE